MKTIKDVMTPDVVWVSPSAQAKSAMFLLKGHGIDALPVVYSHDSVVGIVYCSSLLGHGLETPVMEIMSKEFTTVTPDMPVYQAADLMKSTGRSHILVVESGTLVGIVSRSDIIDELGRSYDTLTNLPLQDAFREWTMTALENGREISILLIDLDQFGRFNKLYGHVMGDRVLQGVADVLKAGVDPQRDFLVRYAGDEFAIGTYRLATEAYEFGKQLMEGVRQIEIPGLPEHISATFGAAGGRRVDGRQDAHSAATLDDLITNASLNCTLSKPQKPEAPQEATAAGDQQPAQAAKLGERARLKIQTIRLATTATEATSEVILSRGTEEFVHTVSGYSIGGRSMLRLVAEATAGAVSKSLSSDHGVAIDEVSSFQTVDEREMVMAIATFVTPRGSTTHAGCAFVRRSDPYKAAAAAVLSALNRQIAAAPWAEIALSSE